mmetsp:Transcript_21380/g.53325  ORF Transcript_21380/g.53325 Transcript_21380/m.53325 type:complete len:144 (+) Transcript_21380:51-482(+)
MPLDAAPSEATHPEEIEFDPPLGKVPNFTFSHPVLVGSVDRWRKNGGSTRLLQILKHGSNAKSFRVLVVVSAAMVAVPAVVMLASYAVLVDLLVRAPSAADRMMYAGIAAMISVQVVVIAFLVYAFNERDEPDATRDDDKKDK